MVYDSVTSGIEAATVAWHPLGWKPGFFSEIADFPCRVLQHHYPQVPNLGDLLTLIKNPKIYESAADLLVGGTPCQDFSVAGLRAGMAGARGNLTLEFCRLLIARRYRWFVWENVPGVLSSFSDEKDGDGGLRGPNGLEWYQTSDFATLLSAFRECGYSCAWRVLDAQYFGVPQRRRRLFVVGHLGDDWRPPAAVLFEPDGGGWHLAAGGKAGQVVAGTVTGSFRNSGAHINDFDLSGGVQPVATTLTRSPNADRGDTGNLVAGTLTTGGAGLHGQNLNAPWVNHMVVCMAHGQANAEILTDQSPTLNCNHEQPIIVPPLYFEPRLARTDSGKLSELAVALRANSSGDSMGHVIIPPMLVDLNQIGYPTNRSNPQPGDPSPPVTSGGPPALVGYTVGVRRLTPLECERLQGFPDNYTNIPSASDAARYEALGNSMAVPVMRWIGRRIQLVDQIFNLKTCT